MFVRINGLGQRSRQNQLPSHPCPAGPAVLYNAQFMFNLPRKVVAVFSDNTFIKEYQFYSDAEPTCTSDANNQISSIYPTVMNNFFSNLHSTSFFSRSISKSTVVIIPNISKQHHAVRAPMKAFGRKRKHSKSGPAWTKMY